MLRIMLPALARAGIANLYAKRAERCCEVTSPRNQPHGERADVRAITIQLDAASHHFYILLVQAF
jgi:hypothetical protein